MVSTGFFMTPFSGDNGLAAMTMVTKFRPSDPRRHLMPGWR
jgi:hypothetical protein